MSQMERIAIKVKDFLETWGLDESIRIYFEGKAWCSKDGWLAEADPRSIVDYGNPDHIIMTLAGRFYDVMNLIREFRLEQAFEIMLEEEGYYSEMGHAWSLTVCPFPEHAM